MEEWNYLRAVTIKLIFFFFPLEICDRKKET